MVTKTKKTRAAKAVTKSKFEHCYHPHDHSQCHHHRRHEHEAVHNDVVDVKALLQKAGLKVTLPRRAILEVLRDQHGPFTAEELRQIIGEAESMESCDLVTIYRCLAKFESLGLISRCDFGDGAVRFELHSADHHHHHIICRVCRRVEPLAMCPVDDKSIRLPDMGFHDVTHRLEFFGVCPNCKS